MQWSKVLGYALGAMLCGCGGGGSSTQTNNAPLTPSAPKEYTRMAKTLGDFYTYKYSILDANGKPSGEGPDYFTRFVSALTGTGSEETETTYQDKSSKYIFSADGRVARLEYNSCSYDYTPAYDENIPATVRLDSSWATTQTRKYSCINGGTAPDDTITRNGNIVGAETITVSAGTFNALKFASKFSRVRATNTLVIERTCWADPDSGHVLKCDETSSTTGANPAENITQKSSYELIAYSHAASGRKKSGAERFAGNWRGVFAGDDNGYCSLITIAPDGTLKGSCQSTRAGGYFNVTGSVDSAGTLTFKLSADGISTPTFVGKLDSPAKMSGTWMLSTGGNGTWYLLHD